MKRSKTTVLGTIVKICVETEASKPEWVISAGRKVNVDWLSDCESLKGKERGGNGSIDSYKYALQLRLHNGLLNECNMVIYIVCYNCYS